MALSSYRIPFLIPYFVEIQRKSFLDFLNIGLISELSKKNPIYDSLKEFKIIFFPKYYQLSLPNYTPKTAILKFQTYKSKLYIPVRFTNCKTKKSKLQWIFLAELPLMTKRGNFIINGAPRIIINQIVRSPGIYYKYIIDQQKRKTYYADLISQRGAWLRFEIDKKNRVWIQMKKTRKIPILIFFKALGISNFKIRQTIKYWNFLENSKTLTENIETENYRHPENTKQSLLWIYTFVYPQKKKTGLLNLFSMKKAKKFLFRKFFSERTYDLGYSGRLQLNKKFNLSIDNKYFVLTCQDLLFIVDYLLKLQKNTGLVDDIDHLKNRKVRTCGELIQNQFATGLIRLEKLITDKTQDFNLCLSEIFTSKPVDTTLRQFFNSSPLSQFMDQTNPLAELTHKRRISSLGPGGISRETAGMDVRGIHPSHYGRICPIETPEGRNAGLVNSLTTLAKINSSGLIETPFFKVFKGQIQTWKSSALFSPRQEQYINLAPSDLKQNYFCFLPSNFIFTKQNDKFKKILRDKIEYIAVSVIQMISIATSLIPFLEHDDANRALMGSNMQRQAVPLILAERPIIGTGLEARVISDSGHGIQSKNSGKISYISSKNIMITNLQNLKKKSTCSEADSSSFSTAMKKSEIFLRASNFENILYKTNNNIFIRKKKKKLFFKKQFLTSYRVSKDNTKTISQTLKNKPYSRFLHYKNTQSNLIQLTFKSVPNLTKNTSLRKKSNNFFSKRHFQYCLNISYKKNFYNWIGFQNCCSIKTPKQFSFLYLNNTFHANLKNYFYNLNFKTYSYLCNTYFFSYHTKLFLLFNKNKLNLIKLNTQKKIGSYALPIYRFFKEKPINASLKINFLKKVSVKNTIFNEIIKKMTVKQCSRKKNRFFFSKTLFFQKLKTSTFQRSFSETHLQSFKKKSEIFLTNFICTKFWIKNLFPFKIFYNINFSFLKKNYLFREFYVSQTHCFHFSLYKKTQINFYFFYIMKKKSLNLVLSPNFCNNTFTKLKLKTTIKNNFIFYIKQFVILFLHEYSKLIFLQTFIKKKNVKHIFFYTSRNWQNFNLEKFNIDFFFNNKNNKSVRFFKNPNFLGYLLFSGKKINARSGKKDLRSFKPEALKISKKFFDGSRSELLRTKINLKQFKLKILKFNSKRIDKYKFFKNLNYFFVVRSRNFILFFQNKTKENLQSCNEKFIFNNYIKNKFFKTYSNLAENKILVTKQINFQEKKKFDFNDQNFSEADFTNFFFSIKTSFQRNNKKNLFHEKFKQSINFNFFFDTNFVLYKKIFIEKTKLNLHLKYNKRLLYPLTLKKKYIFSPLFNNIIQLTNKFDSTQLFINHNLIQSSLFIEKLQILKTINEQILLPIENLQIFIENKTWLANQIYKAPLQIFNVKKLNIKPYYTKKPKIPREASCFAQSFSLMTSLQNIHQQVKLVNQSNYNFSKKKKVNQTKVFNLFKQKNKILNFNLKSQFVFLPQITNYSILTYQHSNQNTCINQTPLVSYGEWVQKGDLLSDGSASAGGDLALGKSILVAYMPWEGYNFEDAILINERLIYDDLYTSIHIEKYKTEICDTPYGLEKITADIPNVSYKKKLKLDSKGIIKIGSWVTSGDILVGKITPIQKKRTSGHEKLLADILEKKNDILTVRDTSLRVPKHVSGRIVHIEQLENDNRSSKQRLSSQGKKKTNARSGKKDLRSFKPEALKISKKFFDGSRSEENFISFPRPSRIHIYIAEKRKIQVGDKMSGRHGNKGIISNILPRQDMPYLADGTTIDMVLNPLGVPSRMNVGQIFECLLGLAANELNEQIRVSIFDEMNGFEATRSLAYSKLFDARLKTGKKWLFNSNFPGKMTVFDGRTGENFKQNVTVGKAYMLKLVHLVDEKIHARSTGPYSLVTQQPVRGRSKHGGQRLGEMEVWALEGFGAAYILQELLTTKSDDIKGRHQVMQAILQRKSLLFGTPESFKVLLSELQSLCLNIGVYSIDNWGIRKKIDIMQLS